MKKRIAAASLALVMATASLPAVSVSAADAPSGWAAQAVTWMQERNAVLDGMNQNLIAGGNLDLLEVLNDGDFANYTRTLTRADFARLGLVLYELLTSNTIPTAKFLQNPFTDTSDPCVIQAAHLGIVGGKGDGIFAPAESVNREQIATMIMRILDLCNVTYNKTADIAGIRFSDEDQLSSWAAPYVKRAYLIQVMNGVGNNAVNPQGTATLEAAYQMFYNIFRNLDDIRAGKVRQVSTGALGTLSLRYYGGAKQPTGWIEQNCRSMPTVCDLDGDGALDILAVSNTITCLNASNGVEKWRMPSGYDRSSPDAASVGPATASAYVGDVDGDGIVDIVTAHAQGTLAVYDNNGYFKPGWPVKVPAYITGSSTPAALGSLEVGDLDGDGTMEIVVGAAIDHGDSVYVYEHDGSLRPGWPQLDPAYDGALNGKGLNDPMSSYSFGIFADTIAIGDIDGDGQPEIVVPADMSQICAYNPDGTQVMTSEVFQGGVAWGRVGAFSDASYEELVPNGGFGGNWDRNGTITDVTALPMDDRLTATFTHSKAAITDLDGNGTNEVIVAGPVHDRALGGHEAALNALYHELFIFNGDRTRFDANWRYTDPNNKTMAGPLNPFTNNDWDRMERCAPEPVCADLDGDGRKEVLYADFNGKLNCYWLDHTQHGSWPLSVYDGTTPEYASTPVVHDLNKDGKPEIIFTTITPKNGNKKGTLYIADTQGNVIQKADLPDSVGDPTPNCCLAQPVIADLDGNGKEEIVLHTYLSGITVYELN